MLFGILKIMRNEVQGACRNCLTSQGIQAASTSYDNSLYSFKEYLFLTKRLEIKAKQSVRVDGVDHLIRS